MPEYQSDPIIQRLDRLERENWYWKRATLLLLIVIASAILMGQAEKPFRIEAETIEAQSFVLKDGNGKRRGELGDDLYHPTLSTPTREKFDKADRPLPQTSEGF